MWGTYLKLKGGSAMLLIDFGIITFGTAACYLVVDKFNIGQGLINIFSISKNKKLLDQYTLLIGYSGKLLKKQIVINMKITPHLLVCGLSGSGKSKMVENAISDKKNIVLLNAFEDDFTSIKGRRINGNENILNYLKSIVEEPYKRIEPLYIVIDELLVLCMDKKVNKAIADLLAIGRHYNIFVIGISQRGEKTELPYKNLFNSRVCFRQVEESSYRAILGFSPEDKKIKHREFYLYSDEISKGKTYDLKQLKSN